MRPNFVHHSFASFSSQSSGGFVETQHNSQAAIWLERSTSPMAWEDDEDEDEEVLDDDEELDLGEDEEEDFFEDDEDLDEDDDEALDEE